MSRARIALVTSDHRRHRWLAGRLASMADLVALVSESKPAAEPGGGDPRVTRHLAAREATEEAFFTPAPRYDTVAERTLALAWQGANGPQAASLLEEQAPDLVFLFGSCIIRDPILERFEGRIVNMHLGLSPYYRGSATNFWPLVDGLPECVGVTVHHATARVDGGAIIAQARPATQRGDDAHAIGCRAIEAGAAILEELARRGSAPDGTRQSGGGKLCRRRDFSLDALRRMHENFASGMIPRYIDAKSERDACYPIHERLACS